MRMKDGGIPKALRAVTVYCGSSPGTEPEYAEAARAFGAILARERLNLVWGGGDFGLMGEVSRSVVEKGGVAYGFIPDFLTKKERPSAVAKITLTPDMHARKWSMFDNGDGLAILPGGIGTLEEFFEMLTWNQLGLHSKPMVLVNIGGIWDPLTALLHHLQKKGFIPSRIAYDCLYTVTSVEEVVPQMREHLRSRNVVALTSAAS